MTNIFFIMDWLLKHKGYLSAFSIPFKYFYLAITRNYWKEFSISFEYFNKKVIINHFGGLSMLDEIFIKKKYLIPINEKNPVIFDVGANVGFYSIWASLYYNDLNPKIYSYEPVRKVYSVLEKNTSLNNVKNISLNNSGVSNHIGKETIYLSYASGKSSIFHKTAKSEQISLTTLSEEAKKHNIKTIDILKIDTEGSEYQILQDIFNSKPRINVKNIVLEYHSSSDYNLIHKLLSNEKYKILDKEKGNIGIIIASKGDLKK